MTPLKDCINYLLTGAQHTVFQMMKKELKIFDITPIQYGVLKCIWEYDLHNPKEIAETLMVENSTISGVLERMEAKDLITREIDDNDRRYIRICLTKRGKELEGPVNEAVDCVNHAALYDLFTEEEVCQIRKYLRTIAGIEE